jgi:hypothetical protein
MNNFKTAEKLTNMSNDSIRNIKLDCMVVSNEDLSSAEGLNIDSDEISGIPESSDPAKTDIEIRESIVPDYNDEN